MGGSAKCDPRHSAFQGNVTRMVRRAGSAVTAPQAGSRCAKAVLFGAGPATISFARRRTRSAQSEARHALMTPPGLLEGLGGKICVRHTASDQPILGCLQSS
jgi:hypothetical protein